MSAVLKQSVPLGTEPAKPMLAKDGGNAPAHYPVALEPKYDGIRALAVIRNGAVAIQSRTGKPFPSGLAKLVHALGETARCHSPGECDFMLDGELVARDGAFADTQSLVMAKHGGDPSEHLRFMVFDRVPAGWEAMPYRQRRALMEKALHLPPGVEIAPMVIAGNEAEFRAFRAKCRADGFEGVMSKDLDAPYVAGRSGAWRKHKDILTLDGRIAALEEGVGRFAGTLGAVTVEGVYEGRRVKCSVGTGFTSGQRDTLWNGRDGMIGKMAEIKFQEITVGGSVRFPVFVRLRSDIDAC